MEKCYFDYSKENGKNIIQKIFVKLMSKLSRNSIFPFVRIFCLKRMGVEVDGEIFLGIETYIDDTVPELIKIGNGSTISFRVMIIAHKEKSTRGSAIVSPVVIGENVFIGAGSIILPGVKIGEGSVIGAGSIVTKNVEKNTTVVGKF